MLSSDKELKIPAHLKRNLADRHENLVQTQVNPLKNSKKVILGIGWKNHLTEVTERRTEGLIYNKNA